MTMYLFNADLDLNENALPQRKSRWRKVFIFIALFSSDMFSYMCFEIMAPFFPKEAEMKYMSPAVTGWVFGIYSITQFVFSPLSGMLIPSVGSRFLFLSGTFFAGGCTILFGFLDRVPATKDNNVVFTFLCFILRICVSLGCTATATANFTIATLTFPGNVATVMGGLETAVGLGLLLGPAIGGFLYEAGGFLLPFLSVGTCLIVSVPLYFLILPQNIEAGGEEEETSPTLALLRIPLIFSILVTVFVSALLWIAPDPILEPFLRKFDLSVSQVGLIFLLLAGTYVLLAPLAGWVASHMDNSTPLLITGFAFLSVGLLLIGPSPLIGLGSYSELWLVLVSLVILGIGMSLTIVTTYEKVLSASKEYGFAENVVVNGALAGLWSSAYALGEFIGPIYSGAAYEAIGFQWTMTGIAGATILMFFLCSFIYLYECKNIHTKLKHAETLLQGSSDGIPSKTS